MLSLIQDFLGPEVTWPPQGIGGYPQTALTSLSHVPKAPLHLLLSSRWVKDTASLQGSLSTPRVLTSLPQVVAPTHFFSPNHPWDPLQPQRQESLQGVPAPLASES